MKKFNALLILATFAMAACDSANTKSVSPVASSNEDIVSSSEAPVPSSSEEPLPASSSNPAKEAKTAAAITPTDFPAQNQGKYLSAQELTIGEVPFYVNDVQKNDGKYKGTSTIQMKKIEDEEIGATSYIQNLYPIRAKLTISLIANIYKKYEEGKLVDPNFDGSVCPTVYAGNSDSDVTTKLTGVDSGNHVNKQPYSVTFEDAAKYQYFKIVNESFNAQYLVSIVWGN